MAHIAVLTQRAAWNAIASEPRGRVAGRDHRSVPAGAGATSTDITSRVPSPE